MRCPAVVSEKEFTTRMHWVVLHTIIVTDITRSANHNKFQFIKSQIEYVVFKYIASLYELEKDENERNTHTA